VLHPSHAPIPPAGAAELTRQRLIRAALELFTTRGYHDTTTAQIAKKAGIAEGTIYRHFASKQQLVNELYRAAQRWAAKVVQEAARNPDAGTARAQLTAVAHGLIDGAVNDGAVVKLGLLEKGRRRMQCEQARWRSGRACGWQRSAMRCRRSSRATGRRGTPAFDW
jgi:AcrR family transcriptional regulator